MNKTTEWCPHCDNEVELSAIKYSQQDCPSCGVKILACSMCREEDRDPKCNNCGKNSDNKW